jgi:methylase of polypeptide subunit release factors
MAANRNELQTALQKPYDRILFAKEVLSPVFGSCFTLNSTAVPVSLQPNKSEQAVIQSVFIYGTIHLEDGTEITCYEINLQPSVRIEQSKVAIQRYVRKLLTAGQIALVNFISPQNTNVWRLTLIAKDSELTEQGIKEKTTHAKRYTYLLGPSESCKTAAERFETLSTERQITFQSLVNAFSVEKLSKAFFDEYTLHYQKFCDYLQESNFRKSVFNISIPPNATNEEKDKAFKPIRDFVKKLLGRIVFLYFVQKKGWLGASDTQYKDGLTDFIKQLFKQSGGNDAFYSTWLKVLFFETLNKERNNDDFIMPNGKKVKVPFLNGGLFDKEKYDEATLTIPATLFHHPDLEEIPLTAKNNKHARGFLDFLDAFNFTVHEDSPDDQTVAVDPEMLGHIFENLLEDNKDKGAFYTPKEIVHYMCQESLTEYCLNHDFTDAGITMMDDDKRKLIESIIKKKEIDTELLKKSSQLEKFYDTWLRQLEKALDHVKICDPAIGSGAFPMGLLQEIHAIKEVIAYELQLPWKPAEVKENIIQNSIYGVDIEKGAVDIARLRFWLSLVVDEEKPRALPNLDYKIVVGDSLVSKFEDEIIEIDWEIKEGTQGNLFGNENVLKRQELLKKITAKQQEYFHATHKQKLAEEIRNLKIDILINQLELMMNTKGLDNKPSETGKKAAAQMELWLQTQGWKNAIAKLQKLKQNNEAPFEHFDWKLDFPEVLNPYLVNGNAGFDIVIGNPPYVSTKGIDQAFKKELEKCFGFADDLYNHFFFKGMELLKPNGTLSFISSKTFWTIQTKKNLRELILKNQLLTLFDTANPFESAMVDTCVCIIKKHNAAGNYHFTYLDGTKDLQKPIKSAAEISYYTGAPNQVFFPITDYNIKIIEKYGKKVNQLLNQWWDKISTSKNIEKYKNELEKYRQSLKPGDITLLGLITEGGVGIQTGNNGKYVGVLEGTKWAENVRKQRPEKLLLATQFCKAKNIRNKQDAEAFLSQLGETDIRKLFDELKEQYGRDVFGQGWLYRIVSPEEIADVETLTEDEKLNGIKGKKTFVPYDKGDKDGNRWYAPTPYYIDWSRENVKLLQTDPKARWQGYQFYFREGFCWNNVLSDETPMIVLKHKRG